MNRDAPSRRFRAGLRRGMQFNTTLQIGTKTISNDSPVFIIAEAGVNHGGDMAVARQLIDIAADSGADAVKFQAFKTEHLILDSVEKAPYQQQTTDRGQSQYAMLKALEVTQAQNRELKRHCEARGIIFLSTPFDEASLDELVSLDLPAYKIASTDTTNLPFLERVARTGKPIFLSTGMSYLSEVELALETVAAYNKDVVLLQCTANYPIEDHEANLNVITTYRERFHVLVGYSDHSVGVGAAPFAVPMGARVVEKHFTIDKSLPGPDHRASLSPEELTSFVETVRRVERYMGSRVKVPNLSETQTRRALQKCLVASRPIEKGEAFSAQNMVAKRTGGKGVSPIYFRELLGRDAARSYAKDEPIEQ